jgi:hypothetical protein
VNRALRETSLLLGLSYITSNLQFNLPIRRLIGLQSKPTTPNKAAIQAFAHRLIGLIVGKYVREPDGLPPYKWYAIGLNLSRDGFIDTIRDYSEIEEDMLPHQLCDSLKIVRFVDIWDRLWREAEDFCTRSYAASTHLHSHMLSWVS